MQSIRLQNTIKALLLIGMGLFLYSRIANGTLFYYINERFMGFTLIAVFGLLAVGLSYRMPGAKAEETEHDHGHDHDHGAGAQHHHAGHSHALSWSGVLLVALPIALGILTPPQPLGVAALSNREMNLQLNTANQAATGQTATVRLGEKAAIDKNLLDWWREFQTVPNANEALAGQPVKAIGFVYQDDRFDANSFMLIRFTVSCCVADASVVGLLVQWPADQIPADDTWVEVTGSFVSSTLAEWNLPIVAAQQVAPIEIPQQPYLYP